MRSALRIVPDLPIREEVPMATAIRWLGPATLVVLMVLPSAFGQRPFSNAREVQAGVNVQDKGDIWTLKFEFVDPRMIEVNVPGRGKKVVWYMLYWVSNETKDPHFFIPEFELLTKNNTKHYDEVLPEVQEAIRRDEDKNNRFNFQNSVTIRKTEIPPSKPDAVPRRAAGIAIWTDVYEKARNTAGFRIFVTGLSNGWAIDDDGNISRKTLILEFDRRGDGSKVDSSEIVFKPNGYKWVYRDAASAEVDLKRPDSVKPPSK